MRKPQSIRAFLICLLMVSLVAVFPGVAFAAKYIPDLAAADIKLNLQREGFRFTGPRRLQTMSIDSGKSEGSGYQFDVDIYEQSPTKILWVEATAFNFGGITDRDSIAFLGYVATVPYRGAQPSKARAWVEENYRRADTGRIVETVIGEIKFQMYGPSTAKVLEIKLRDAQ